MILILDKRNRRFFDTLFEYKDPEVNENKRTAATLVTRLVWMVPGVEK